MSIIHFVEIFPENITHSQEYFAFIQEYFAFIYSHLIKSE